MIKTTTIVIILMISWKRGNHHFDDQLEKWCGLMISWWSTRRPKSSFWWSVEKVVRLERVCPRAAVIVDLGRCRENGRQIVHCGKYHHRHYYCHFHRHCHRHCRRCWCHGMQKFIENICERDQEPHIFLFISNKNGTSKLEEWPYLIKNGTFGT